MIHRLIPTALVLFAALALHGSAKPVLAPLRPQAALPKAQPFRLADVTGHEHSLSQFRGHPLVLFFMCGCAPCHACARLWTQVQTSEASAPVTIVVFSGGSAAARAFATQTGLSAPQNLVLTDPTDLVSSAYGVTVCPREFVLDSQGRVCYTNDAPGTDPQTTPSITLVSHALTAWRDAH